MNKYAKRLVVLFVALLVFSAVALCLAACTDPNESGEHTLTLNVGDGGTLSKTQYKLAAGENVADFVKEISPTVNSGFTFVGWYEGSAPLMPNRTMPSSDLTLTAMYNVQYTVNVYRQAADASYPSVADSSTTGQALYGQPFTCEIAEEEHFEIDKVRSTYSTESLAKDAVFNVYLQREAVRVIYIANVTGATPQGNVEQAYVPYGGSVALADGADFKLPSYYRFAGWATTPNGEVAYLAGDTLTNVTGTVYLYGQWDRAYLDRFGGSDCIFFPRSDDTVAILVRGGLEEKIGVREGKTFHFDEVGLSGIVSDDGSFAYFNEDEAEVYVNWNAYDEELREDVKLTLDGYMNGTCEYVDEDGETKTFAGRYRLSVTGLYYFEITEGEHEGAFFYFLLSEMTQSKTPIFVAMGQEALYGEVLYAMAADLNGSYSISGSYTVVFDGFGVVSVSGLGTFYYRHGDTANEYVAYLDGIDILRMYVVQFTDSMYGWLLYDSELAGEYRGDDGERLVLDGYGFTSIYNDGGQDQTGAWIVDSYSELQNGYVVRTGRNVFLVYPDQHRFKRIETSFFELNLLTAGANGAAVDTSYCMVIFEDGTAELYVSGTRVVVGSWQYLSAGLYEFTRTELIDSGVQFPEVLTFKMMTFLDYYDTGDTFDVYVMVEATTGGEKVEYYHSYFENNGNEVRIYDVGTADYILRSGTVYQAYSYYQDWTGHPFFYDYICLTYSDSNGRANTLYFRIEEDGSLTSITRSQWSIPRGLPTGDYDGSAMFFFDGGGFGYLYPPRDSGWVTSYGTYSVKQVGNEFSSDVVIYTFVAYPDLGEDLVFNSDMQPAYSFDFIFGLVDDYYPAYFIYDAERAGQFTSAGSGTYLLDGFAQDAIYVDTNGVRHSGSYYLLGDNVIRFTDSANGRTRDVELDLASRTFEELDGYYGEYRCYDGFEFAPERVVLHFDGRGGAELGHLDYSDKYVKDGEGTYVIHDDANGVLLVQIEIDGYDGIRVLLLYVDVGYAEYYAYVRAIGDENTYYSSTWEVLYLDGFGYATYTNAQGVVYRDVMYTELDDNKVEFVIGQNAYLAEIDGNTFEITDIYFKRILLAEYGNLNYMYYGPGGTGVLFLSIYQIDAAGTIVAIPTGAIDMTGNKLKDAYGDSFEIPDVTDYSITYYGNGGGIITLDFKYDDCFCHVEYTISELFSGLYYVTSVSYYWTRPTNWTWKNGGNEYTVTVYRQVRGSDNSVRTGTVRSFTLAINGNELPIYGYGKTEPAGIAYAKVLDGEYAGYYFVNFNKDGSGVETGINLITKWNVQTVTGTDVYDGTVITSTAYYVLDTNDELFDVHVRYTQSDFGGREYDLTTESWERLTKTSDTWFIHCTYNYGGSYYTSDFYYAFTYNQDEASLVECYYGVVYSLDGNYAFTMLVGYSDLVIYRIDEMRINGVKHTVSDDITREGSGSFRITTATAVFRVTIISDGDYIDAEVEVVTDEKLQTIETTADGVNFTVTYSVMLGTENAISDVISLAANGDLLVYYSYAKLANGKFAYVVLDSDFQGYYVITFALGEGGVVQGVSIEKLEIVTTSYVYRYNYGGEDSYTEFVAYYVMDGDELGELIAMTYRVGEHGTVVFFDDYVSLKDVGNGTWWMYYAVGSSYYHFALTLGDEAELMLCYYSPTYGSEDSTYTFYIAYDMEGNGNLYAIGAMKIGSDYVEIESATKNADGSWTIVTPDATYNVTFTYDSEQETFSATVTVVTD